MHKLKLIAKQSRWSIQKAVALNMYHSEIYAVEKSEDWDSIETWEKLEPILFHFETECDLNGIFDRDISFEVFNQCGELVQEGSV